MSLSFGFYNSSNHDRVYDSRQLSRLFNALIKDGVFMHIGSHFAVVEGSGMSVNVGTGYAWFNSTWTLNDAPLPITVEESDLLLTRIDALVLEVNETVNSRTNSIKFVKGTPSANPQKPSLTNTNDVHQYALAYITVAPGTETITQANIENNVGKEDCPFVVGILETIDISSLIAQWEAQWDEWLTQQKEETDEFQKTSEAEFTAWSNERKQEITNFQESSEASFIAWFETIRGKLGEDPAGELQNQVDELKAAVTGYPLKFSANTNSLQITAKRNSIESIGVTGFTKQAGSGDASPVNKRAISVATKRMVKVVFDGSEDESWSTTTVNYAFRITLPMAFGGTAYAGYLIYGGTTVASAPDMSFVISSNSFYLIIKSVQTLDALKLYLKANPLPFWFAPTDEAKATGIYLPIERTDESGYHCDCIKLSADLCKGDKVETFVKSGCDVKMVFDGSSDERWYANTSHKWFYIPVTGIVGAKVFSDRFAGVSPLAFGLPSGCIAAHTTENNLMVSYAGLDGIETPQQWKEYLQSNPLPVWIQSTAYTGRNDIPVQKEEHVNWLAKIDASSKFSIWLSQNGGTSFTITSTSGGKFVQGGKETIADILPSITNAQLYITLTSSTHGIGIGNSGNLCVAVPGYSTVEDILRYFTENNAIAEYPLAAPVIYVRDPVFIDNSDGSTVISAPEGCTMELSLVKNEAKLYKATLLKNSWATSGSEFTQEASAKCVEGFGALTADSKWDSPIYTEQTNVLATNEKLIDALTILNMGEILFKDGVISCRVSEKPVSDIEILFKAKR